MADPYTFTFDVEAYLKEQETAFIEALEQGVMKRPVKEAEPVVENATDSIKTRMANALKSVFPDSTALGAAPKGDTSAGRSKALSDWTVSTEPFMPRFLGDVPASKLLKAPPVTTTELSPTIDTMAMQDAQEQAAIRSTSGITESLGRPAPAGLGGAPVQPETPVIYEAGATVTNGKDSPVGSPTPAGLMSPPAQEGVSGVDTDTGAAVGSEDTSGGLLDFIGTGEGGYDSANRGTIGGNVIGSQRVASRGGKKVSELTVAEIKKYQSITDPNNKDRLFTVGKYQAIPDTFNQAVKGLGLSDDTVFTPEVQEQVGLYLVAEKRPTVGKFLRGEGDVTTNTAMLELAKEFASIPVPFAIAKGKYGKWPKTDLVAGDSFYKNPKASKGNRAGHTVAETRAVLEAAVK